jgi:uncharacterized protein
LDYLLIFIVLAIVAEILGTVGGFGSSLFFVPIASYFLDFQSVLGITALFHVLSNLTKIYFFKAGFSYKIILTIGLPSVIFVIFGAYLSKLIETFLLEVLLSIFLILLSLFLFFFKNIKIKANIFNSIMGGSISGFFAGLIGTGGAIRGLTLTSFNLKKEVFIATSAIIDLGIDSSRSVIYFLNGYIHKDDLYLIPILFCVSIIGTFIGKKILNLLNEKQFKSIVLSLILITGIVSFFRFF